LSVSTNARSVILAALMQPVPCPRCASTVPCRCIVEPGERLEWQAALIEQALASQDLLIEDPADSEPDIEAIAKWLAEQSRHARYGGPDGYLRLLDPDSENNVHHAHAQALRAAPRIDRDSEAALSRAREALLHELAVRRAARVGG
jgi:hypothetical protein